MLTTYNVAVFGNSVELTYLTENSDNLSEHEEILYYNDDYNNIELLWKNHKLHFLNNLTKMLQTNKIYYNKPITYILKLNLLYDNLKNKININSLTNTNIYNNKLLNNDNISTYIEALNQLPVNSIQKYYATKYNNYYILITIQKQIK